MRAKITYFVLAAVLVVYFVLVGDRGRACSSGTAPRSTVAFGVARAGAAAHRRLVPVADHPVRRAAPTGSRRELDAEGGLPVDELVRTPERPDRPGLGRRGLRQAPGRDGGRTRRTGAAGSGSPSPTTTPATPPAPARRCSAPSPCTTASPSRPPDLHPSPPVLPVRERAGPRSRRTGPFVRSAISRAGTPRPTPRPRPPPGRTPRRGPGSRRCAWSAGACSAGRSRRETVSACPCTVRGSPSQRTGCCTVCDRRPAPTAACACRGSRPGAARARSPTRRCAAAAGRRRSPAASRRRHTAAPDTEPVSAMTTAANSTNEASSSSSAATPDPPGAGAVGAPPAVVVVEGQGDVVRRFERAGRPSERAGARLVLTRPCVGCAR